MPSYTCFLIDDDPDDRELFSIVLRDIDPSHNLATAVNGVDALKKINDDTTFIPDYIFLDLNMPLMSGKECLPELKKIERLRNIPVIIYTTSSGVKDVETTRQMGADHFLIKPYDLDVLSKILKAFLEKHKMPFLIEEEAI